MSDTAVAEEKKSATLDDVMIAMDVVDTVRHRDDLVRRELNEVGREAELIARLKEIYRQQGIDVPDHVLAEGVKALKESRFTYVAPPAGLKRTLLTLWTKRQTYGRIAAVALGLVGGGYGLHHVANVRPAQVEAERVRVELNETLPKAIRQAHADVAKVATDPAARTRADQVLADAERAIRDGNRTAMTKAAKDLAALRDEIAAEYALTIVSRPGETSGVWRRPPNSPQGRNYYLVVEAIALDGSKLSIPIRNEENGITESVHKFGVRVPKETFEAVASDKRDDGIIQKNRFGTKRRGTLSVDYQMPYDGGMITRW